MGLPSLSSSILNASLPPKAGSARRSRIIESRTQKTNCLYLELVISVSSIQKESIDTPRAFFRIPATESSAAGPMAIVPLSMRTIPYGVGSANEAPPTPVTSPPAPLRRTPAQEDKSARRTHATLPATRGRIITRMAKYDVLIFFIFIIVATLFEWNGVYSCFSLRD